MLIIAFVAGALVYHGHWLLAALLVFALLDMD